MHQKQMRIAATVLFVLGALALIVAILYFALPAHSLPGFLPGRVAHITGHRNRRGAAAIVVALLFGAVGLWAFRSAKSAPA